jgi:hypothetical protein
MMYNSIWNAFSWREKLLWKFWLWWVGREIDGDLEILETEA